MRLKVNDIHYERGRQMYVSAVKVGGKTQINSIGELGNSENRKEFGTETDGVTLHCQN